MEQKNKHTDTQNEVRRKWMIEFIVKTIEKLDDRKLSNVYHLVLHIR